jgi:uncharacterized protein (DUF697 family)
MNIAKPLTTQWVSSMERDDYNKNWWESKGVVGGLVAAICGVAGLFGIIVAPEDAEIIVTAITAIGGAIGGIIAAVGRIKATKNIK